MKCITDFHFSIILHPKTRTYHPYIIPNNCVIARKFNLKKIHSISAAIPASTMTAAIPF